MIYRQYIAWVITCLCTTGLLLIFSPQASAQNINLNISDRLPTQANLIKLREKIDREPYNLDHYFNFAAMATALKKYDLAARAYEDMLVLRPELDRIKLDLGTTYMQLGKLDEAKALLEEVLHRNPPDVVKDNINTLLAKLAKDMQEHEWKLSTAVGLNVDSNATSASTSGRITVLNTDIPLDNTQQEDQDMQYFATATVTHRYAPRKKLNDNTRFSWDSSASYFQLEQETEDSLDLRVASVKTGPTLFFKEEQITTGLDLGFTHITLDNHSYLRLYSAEADLRKPLSERIIATLALRGEARDFIDSPTVSTFDDRQGHAYQIVGGMKFILDEAHFLDVDATLRREETRVVYYDNKQWALNAALTKVLPYDSFAQFRAGYKQTNYDGADPLISVLRRHDNEKKMGLTLGTRFADDFTFLLGYEYRDNGSNIQNFTYDNHRFSTSVSWQY